MSDIMPKFDNTLQMKLEASALFRQQRLLLMSNAIESQNNNKMNFVKFIQTYASTTNKGIEDLSFLGFFTVIDIATLRLLCRDTAHIFDEEVQQNVIRIGNLDPSIRIYFWVMQAPFYE